ncbi:hypothetical protein J4429_02945 [Candidatus Pacearchaeota archaeon]|nr:hypothetical protein [Candidatus Pacearchaeota archaeon]
MVYQIIKNYPRFRVFLDSLIITILILIIGFFIGYYIEYLRTNSIVENYKNFEISALDLKLQNYYYQIMDDASCKQAIEQNFIFADNIYKTGLDLERYENVNELTKDILLEKKRYVLLKTELWLNSILLKKKCNNPFHTVVYVYTQKTDTKKDAEQGAISNVLKKIKEENGNKIILIPIAGDLGLDAVEMQMQIYNVTYFPSVIIDEKIVLKGFQKLEEIEKYVK